MWWVLVYSVLLFVFYTKRVILFVLAGVSLFYLLTSVALPFSGPFIMSEFFVVDSVALVFIILKMVTISAMVLSVPSTEEKGRLAMIFLFVVILNSVKFCFLSGSWLLFYIFFELSVMPMMFMMFLWGLNPERLSASSYLLVYSLIGSLPLLMVMVLASQYSSLSMIFFKKMPFNINLWHSLFSSVFISVFWLVAFLMKTPMFGAHLWLPKAHVEAPVFGSMFLAAVLLKLGTYGLLRLKIFVSFPWSSSHSSMAKLMLIWVCLSLPLVGLMCFNSKDMKSFMAYSSVVHMAVTLIGCVVLSVNSTLGLILMSLGHGFMSSSMFFSANLFYSFSSTRKIFLKTGIKYLFPILFLFWFIVCSCNCSMPPFMSLFGEILVSTSVVGVNSFSLMFIFFVVFMSGLYSIYLCFNIVHSSSVGVKYSGNFLFSHYFCLFFNTMIGLCMIFFLFYLI